jgi:putative SOS response-associated peptidase YedK
MRWGVVPYWAKDPSIGIRTINAKAETITTAPAFREAIKYRRCLVPADAFYEWQKLGAKNKQPFAITMKDGEPYALAGFWERWKDSNAGTELLTFTVVTTDPNEVVEPPCMTECQSSSRNAITTAGSGQIPSVHR